MTFPELHATLRTDKDFILQLQQEHHKGNTPLEKIGIGLQDALYSVVKFNAKFNNKEDNETYSVIPTIWLKDNKYTYWPKKNVRNCIIKRKPPRNDWTLYPVTIIAKYDLYEHALKKEKRLMDDKNTTESENNLGRGLRQKKPSQCFAEENDDANQNVREKNHLAILHTENIPVIIDETGNNTIPVVVNEIGNNNIHLLDNH
ncbi:hypothetical protein RF55_16265, partial [Lasius niger]